MQNERNTWTVMVYLGGDNNLAEEMVYALKCMKLVGSNYPKYEVFALYDGGVGPATLKIKEKKDEDFPPRKLQGVEKLLEEVEEDREKRAKEELEIAKQELETAQSAANSTPKDDPAVAAALKEALTALEVRVQRLTAALPDAKTELSGVVQSVQAALTEFVFKTIKNNPAEYYMLVLSGHGSGAVGDFLTGEKRFAGLSIPDLREALTVIQELFEDPKEDFKDEPFLKNGKIDILGLDSCVMGMAEVAYEVRECVSYVVGAEGFEPNAGWPYDLILSLLRKDPLPRPEEFARQIVQQYVEYYSSDYTVADVSTHLSVLALDRIERLVNALGRDEGLFEPLRNEVERYLKDAQTQTAVTSAFEASIESAKTELEDYAPGLVTAARKAIQYPHIELLIAQVAEELPTALFDIARSHPATKDAMAKMGSADWLKNVLSRALDATQDDIVQLGTESQVSEALKELVDKEDTKRGFKGFEKLFEDFRKVLTRPDTATAIRDQLRKGRGVSELLHDAIKTSATLDAIRNGLEWDEGLAGLLTKALRDEDTRNVIKDVVVLAHWKAQGYKFEQHTDLRDFCQCLSERCKETESIYKEVPDAKYTKVADTCKRISWACQRVVDIIDGKQDRKGLVLDSRYCGPAFQHSHGISIFFPWAHMTDASGFAEMTHYKSLEFTHETQWDEFVDAYHEATQRPERPLNPPVPNKKSHPSTLNRRDGLFTAPPVEFGTPLAAALAIALTGDLAKKLGSAVAEEIKRELTANLKTMLDESLDSVLVAQLGSALNAWLKVRLGRPLNARLEKVLGEKLGTGLALVNKLIHRLAAELGRRLGAELITAVGATLNVRLGTALNAKLEQGLNDALSERLGTPTNARLGTPTNARLGTPTNARLGTPTNARLGTPTNARLGTPTNARLGTPTNARLGTPTNARIGVGGTSKIESMKNPPIKWFDQKNPLVK